MALGLLCIAPSVAFSQTGGGVYIYASRSFPDNDPTVPGPFRFQYRNSANTEVQAELTLLGYYHGPIDGNVNPGTMPSLAIKFYQRDHRLPVTGAIDGNLIASLASLGRE